MLYAQMNNHRAKDMDWPLEWEKCHDMFKYLNRIMWGYQLNIERRMFYSAIHPEFRCTLIRWESGVSAAVMQDKKREVLLETSDPAQMEAALIMLIGEAEQEVKKYKMSMVP